MILQKKDPRRMAALIISHPGMGQPAPEEDPGLVSAMDEFISAIKGEDSEAAAVALKDFISIYESSEDETESE